MLKTKDNKSRKNSIYICDRCKKELHMSNEKVFSVYIKTPTTNMKKKWDLCELDYKRLCKGIANWTGGKNEKV